MFKKSLNPQLSGVLSMKNQFLPPKMISTLKRLWKKSPNYLIYTPGCQNFVKIQFTFKGKNARMGRGSGGIVTSRWKQKKLQYFFLLPKPISKNIPIFLKHYFKCSFKWS